MEEVKNKANGKVRSVLRSFTGQHQQVQAFLWIPVGLGLGIGLFFAAPVEPDIWAGPVFTGLLVVLVTGTLYYRKTQLFKFFPVLVGILVTAIGFTVATMQTHRHGTAMLPHVDRFMSVTGYVERIERRTARTRLTLAVTRLDPAPDTVLPRRIRISMGKGTAVAIGDLVTVNAVISGPGPPIVPDGFDFRRWSWFQGLGGSGFAVGPLSISQPGALDGWGVRITGLRDTISKRILDAYPDQSGAIAAAVIVGDRSALNEDTLDAMRASGLAHLLAISGLHLGLLAGTVFFAIRFALASTEATGLSLSVKKVAAIFALTASFLYVLLAGAPIPTVRAFVMTGLVLVAVLSDRSAISMRLVAWAATVILILQPESMLGPSFQMSFAAVVALVAFYESTAPVWREKRVSAGWIKQGFLYFLGILVTTVIAGGATAPFAWHHFGQIGGYGALANLAAIPIMAFLVMPFALLGLLLMPFGIEGIALWPAVKGLHIILSIAETIAGLDGAMLRKPTLPLSGLLFIVAGGLWLSLWRQPTRHLGWISILVGVVIGSTTIRPDVLIAGNAKLTGIATGEMNLTLTLDPAKRETFISEQWKKFYGYEWLDSLEDLPSGTMTRCDPWGCLHKKNGWTVALTRDPRALLEDCSTANVVISPIPVHRAACKGPQEIVDFFSLKHLGTHAVYLKERAILIETAETGSKRLWHTAAEGE